MLANNEEIIARAEAEPAEGGNLAKLTEIAPEQQTEAFEASYFKY